MTLLLAMISQTPQVQAVGVKVGQGRIAEQLCAMTQRSFYKTKPKQTDPPDLRVEVNIVQNAEALTVKEIVKKSVVLKNKFFSGQYQKIMH